jgi:hypothetical protein
MKKVLPYLIVVIIIGFVIFLFTRPSRTTETTEDNSTKVQSTDPPSLPSSEKMDKKSEKPNINIYMENSGSMDGYVTINSEFKDALGNIVVQSHNGYAKKSNFYFINNDIHPIDTTIFGYDMNNFVAHLSPKSMKIGHTESTNINDIFKIILSKTDKKTVSVLFSDCVYSIKGSDIASQINNAKNATMGAFMDALDKNPELGVIILQCQSDFNGYYYDRNDKPILYRGKRPYYVFFIGDVKYLQDINTKMDLNNSQTGIHGLLHKYMLSNKVWTVDDNSARTITSDYTNASLIKTERNFFDIHEISTDRSASSSTITFAVGVDMQNLFVDESYIQDPANYSVKQPGCSVYGIQKITSNMPAFSDMSDFSDSNRLYAIKIKTNDNQPQFDICLQNILPKWVNDANIPDDSGIVPDGSKTFAISSMIEGIYDAFYHKISYDNKNIFNFSINIKEYN